MVGCASPALLVLAAVLVVALALSSCPSPRQRLLVVVAIATAVAAAAAAAAAASVATSLPSPTSANTSSSNLSFGPSLAMDRPIPPKPAVLTQPNPAPARAWHDKITVGGEHPPEVGRYHLYIGLFCPFAHRANLVRHLKGLQDILPVTVVRPYPKGDSSGWPGWMFPATADEYEGSTPDPVLGATYVHELFFKSDPGYTGRYSVPVLWDKKTNTIVNTESAELMRDLQTCFDTLLPADKAAITLYPEALRAQIDAESVWMQRYLNSGVYTAGFAKTQEAYDAAVPHVFAALNRLEKMIAAGGGPYILGATMTELDVRAYASVVRFDAAYAQHFKVNLGLIRHDYPQIHNWLRNLYWNVPGFRETTDFRHIKENYTKSHPDINPLAITPMGFWPPIEDGPYEPDLTKVPIGGVKMPLVLDLEAKIEPKL